MWFSSSTRRGSTTSASRGRESATTLRPAKTASAHPPSAGACSPIRSNAPGRETPVPLSTPFHTTRSRYRRTDTCEQRRKDQCPPNDQESCRECSANHLHQSPITRCHQPRPCISSRPTTRSSHLGSRPLHSNALGHRRGGKETFGGGDGEHFLGFGCQRHLPTSLQHFELPKTCRPPQVGHLRLLVRHDTRYMSGFLLTAR